MLFCYGRISRSALHEYEWSHNKKKVEWPNRERPMYKCHDPYKSCRPVNPILHFTFINFQLMNSYIEIIWVMTSNRSLFLVLRWEKYKYEKKIEASWAATIAVREKDMFFSYLMLFYVHGTVYLMNQGFNMRNCPKIINGRLTWNIN